MLLYLINVDMATCWPSFNHFWSYYMILCARHTHHREIQIDLTNTSISQHNAYMILGVNYSIYYISIFEWIFLVLLHFYCAHTHTTKSIMEMYMAPIQQQERSFQNPIKILYHNIKQWLIYNIKSVTIYLLYFSMI